MAFLSGAAKVNPEESLTFNYWIVIITLLKIGIPYDQILQLSEVQISTIIGIHNALEQRQADEQDRQERIAASQQRRI